MSSPVASPTSPPLSVLLPFSDNKADPTNVTTPVIQETIDYAQFEAAWTKIEEMRVLIDRVSGLRVASHQF